MKKMFIKLSLTMLFVFSLCISSAYADFVDMPSDPVAKEAMEIAVKNGLLTGYDTGEIKPENNITRAEMAAIIVRAFGAEKLADEFNFADVTPDKWYYDVMSKSVSMGVFKGDGANLNPESDITFQEAFAVLARVFDLQTYYDVELTKYQIGMITDKPENVYPALDKYSDRASVAEWAVPTTAAIIEGGYWDGVNMQLCPTQPINRAQFAILMNNLVSTYIDAPGTYDELPAGNVVVRTGGVTINTFDNPSSKIIIGGNMGADEVILGDGVNVERAVIYSGTVTLGGSYNFVRILGRGCVGKLLPTTKITVQAYSRYKDSKYSFGIKEL